MQSSFYTDDVSNNLILTSEINDDILENIESKLYNGWNRILKIVKMFDERHKKIGKYRVVCNVALLLESK